MLPENEIIKRETEKEIFEDIIKYHKEYELKEEKRNKEFNLSSVKEININIWDDFYEDGFVPEGEQSKTYIYVEVSSIPDAMQFKILVELMRYIEENKLLPEEVKMEMNFYDSMTLYPNLILEHKYLLYKRWQINLTNITHKVLEKMLKKLSKFKEYKGVKVSIYSES